MANNYKKGDHDTRPWGTWEVLDAGSTFCVKRITVTPAISFLCSRTTTAQSTGPLLKAKRLLRWTTKKSSAKPMTPFIFRSRPNTESKMTAAGT